MTTEVGSLSIPIEANTASLDKAAQIVTAFGQTFDRSIKRLEKSIKTFSSSLDKVAGSLKGISSAAVTAGGKAEKALASQTRTTILLKAETERLMKAFRDTGQSRQFPELLGTATRQLKTLDAALKKGTISSVEFAKRTAQIEVNNKRLIAVTQKLSSTEKQDSASKKRLKGESDRLIASNKKLTSSLVQVEKSEKKTTKATEALRGGMTDLAKSVSVALGPLNGVAARITAIASLANRNTVAIAGMIGVVIGLGGVMAKAVKAGSSLERELLVLENRFKATGLGGKETFADLQKFAIQLGEDTLESASTVRQAMIVLSSAFGINTERMKEGTRVAADLAASGFGSIQISARRLVRAFTDPASALESLARNGLKLTEQQERLIQKFSDLGKRGKAFDLILKLLNKRVGGAAVASAKGLSGAYDTLGERTTRFLEILSTQGGVLDSLTNSITAVSDSLLEFTNNTNAAAASGNFFAIALESVDTTVRFVADNIGFLIKTVGVLFAGFAIKGIIRLGQSIFEIGKKAVKSIGLIKKLGVVLLGLSLHITGLILLGAAIIGIFKLLSDEKTAVNELTETYKKLDDARKEAANTGKAVDTTAIIKNQIDISTQRNVEILKQIKKTQEQLDLQIDRSLMLTGEGEVRRDVGSQKIINNFISSLLRLRDELLENQEIIDRMQNELKAAYSPAIAKKVEELTEKNRLLSVEQGKVIDNIEKQIKAQDDFSKSVTAFIGGGISGGKIAFELSLDTSKAQKAVTTFLRQIEEKVPKDALERSKVIIEDQVQATQELLVIFKKFGIEAKTLEEAFIKLFQKQRVDELQKKFRELELSMKLNIDASERLAIATLQGGEAVRQANIENQVAAQLYKLGGDKASEYADALRQLIVRLEAVKKAAANAQILKGLRDEVAAAQVQLQFLGDTALEQEQINALIQKELELRARGVDLTSAQAIEERKLVLEVLKLNKQFEIAEERAQSFKSAVIDLGNELADALGNAIVDFRTLSDLVNSLEKQILNLLTQFLITDPIKRGLKTAFGGAKDPTGISQGGGLEGVVASIGDLFGTRKDPTEGIDVDTVEAVTGAFTNLSNKIPEMTSQLTKLGTDSSVTAAIINTALGTSATSSAGSLTLEKVAIDTVTAGLFKMIAAVELATAALAAMAGAGGGGGGVPGVGALVTGLGSVFAGGGGITPGTILGNTGAGLAAGGIPLPKLAHGANFTIGGKGGVDRNLVQFMGSRGEKVSVTPAGQSSRSFSQTLIFQVSGETTQTTMNQIAVTVGRHTQRAISKGLA